jgi:hypothetical protein
MKIILYTTADENIKVNKTLNNSKELYGTLREECSVINPIIEIESVNISNYNYCYIEDFNRYYFIIDIIAVNNKFWKITLHCDVLMSYADSIKKLEAKILRNTNEYNLMLEDNQLNRYVDDRIQTFNFPNSLTIKQDNTDNPPTDSTEIPFDTYHFYLTLIGGGE